MPQTSGSEREDHCFSFIVPAYNSQGYVRLCLDAIVANMADRDEFLVVDNGSTDGTRDIAASYAQAQVLHAPEATIGGLRNRGARAATGDVLAFIDSDCVMCDDWREHVLASLRSHGADATGSRINVHDSAGWIARTWYPVRHLQVRRVRYINSGNLVVRRSAFEAVGGFDEDLVTDEDYDLGIRLNSCGFCVMDNPAIRVFHLKNPRTLREFFARTLWHAHGQTRMRQGKFVDRATLASHVNIGAWVLAACSIPFVVKGKIPWWVILAVLATVPIAVAIYRVFESRSYRHFLRGVLLQFVYFSARSVAILRECLLLGAATLRKSRIPPQ